MNKIDYLETLKNFINEETSLIKKNGAAPVRLYGPLDVFISKDKGYYELNKIDRFVLYYRKMYDFVSNNFDDYLLFDESNVSKLEMDFSEMVLTIRQILINQSQKNNVPHEGIFLPYLYIQKKYILLINRKVAFLIRSIFDSYESEDFQTLRKYKIIKSKNPLLKWIKSINGKNFLFEFQISEGIKKEALIKKRLFLFDKSFEFAQIYTMYEKLWIHNIIVDAFQRWEKDNNLWKKIDHLKRKMISKEILDESRPEIKFLRSLEKNGYSGKFIHDEYISWNVKYRPDYWFVDYNLIDEYDEKTHKFQEDHDRVRERIIKKYLPNVYFIRVKEGFENEGLMEIKSFIEINKVFNIH